MLEDSNLSPIYPPGGGGGLNSINGTTTSMNSSSAPLFPLMTPEQQMLMENLTSVFGWLSLVCTLFLILTFGSFKMKRQYPANFTFYFCIVAFATDLAFIVGSLVGYQRLLSSWHNTCYAQAVALQFFGSATCTWWFLLTVNLFFSAVRRTSHKKYLKFYHIGGWAWCLILTILPIPFKKYGPAGLWCWIVEDNRSAWQFGLLYGWMGVLLVIGCILWCFILQSMVKSRRSGTLSEWLNRYSRYVLFVLLMMLVWALIVIHRIIHAVNPALDSFTLWVLHAWALSSIGVFVFLIFGTAKDMYTCWWERILEWKSRACAKWGLHPSLSSSSINALEEDYERMGLTSTDQLPEDYNDYANYENSPRDATNT